MERRWRAVRALKTSRHPEAWRIARRFHLPQRATIREVSDYWTSSHKGRVRMNPSQEGGTCLKLLGAGRVLILECASSLYVGAMENSALVAMSASRGASGGLKGKPPFSISSNEQDRIPRHALGLFTCSDRVTWVREETCAVKYWCECTGGNRPEFR